MRKTETLLKLIEKKLDETLPKIRERPRELNKAMRYAVGSGGKRIRPLVCLAAAEAVGGKAEDALAAAAAIELMHNYTLVHDDLPAMDNDVMRRGKPTVWKKFGEANAILVGDALQALAFSVAAESPRNAINICRFLAKSGGGVVIGQVEDLKKGMDAYFTYTHKTGDLFVAAAAMGALAAGADAKTVERICHFGICLGLAFQFQDDLIDGDGAFPRESTELQMKVTTKMALDVLNELPGDTRRLKKIVKDLAGRKI